MNITTSIKTAATALIIVFTAVNCSSPTQPEASEIQQDTFSDINFEKSLADIPASTLTDQEVEGLLFMREEEKLARDVYLNLYETYPLFPLRNISRSEQIHMNAVKFLLDRYGIEDPVGTDVKGVFKNIDLQELYNQLVTKGEESEIEALKVGCAIEEIDIIDLQNELDYNVVSPDLKFVYTNLKRASGFHLRAFVWNLEIRGIEYEPQYLEKEVFDEIINPSNKRLTLSVR